MENKDEFFFRKSITHFNVIFLYQILLQNPIAALFTRGSILFNNTVKLKMSLGIVLLYNNHSN